jgi:hypothetical protein
MKNYLLSGSTQTRSASRTEAVRPKTDYRAKLGSLSFLSPLASPFFSLLPLSWGPLTLQGKLFSLWAFFFPLGGGFSPLLGPSGPCLVAICDLG